MVIVDLLWKSNTCCWYIKYKSLIENIQEHHQQQENEKNQIGKSIHQNVSISPCTREKTGQLTTGRWNCLAHFFLNKTVKHGLKINCQVYDLFLLLSTSSNWVKLMTSTMPIFWTVKWG